MLVLPIVVSAASGEAEDPEGDEGFSAAGSGVCRDPAIDLRRLALASDGETLEVRLAVSDGDASASCGGVEFPRRWLTLWAGGATSAGPREGYVEVRYALSLVDNRIAFELGGPLRQNVLCGSLVITYVRADEPDHQSWESWRTRCLGTVAREAGELTWRFPTHGVAPTYAPNRSLSYDLRGLTFPSGAFGTSQAAPGVVVRSISADPFRFWDDMDGPTLAVPAAP